MQIARVVADRLGHTTEERDDFVPNFALDLANTLDVKARLLANARDGGFGDSAESRPTFGGENFYIQPFLKAIFFGPDTAHFRPGVTRNHVQSSVFKVQGNSRRTWNFEP